MEQMDLLRFSSFYNLYSQVAILFFFLKLNVYQIADNCKLDEEKLSDLLTMAFDGKEEETAEITAHCNSKVECTDK